MKKMLILFALCLLPALCFAGGTINKATFDPSPILTADVTVATGATVGLSTASTLLRTNATILGTYGVSNQDQLVDAVAIVNLNPTISGATLSGTSLVRITATAHGLLTGDRVYITGVVGTVELNSNWYSITKIDANTFDLVGTNSANFTAYTSGGTATSEKAQVRVTLAAAATADNVFKVSLFKAKW